MHALIPYALVNSVNPSSLISLFISSIGTDDPAAMPVRSFSFSPSHVPSFLLFSTSANTPRKCVGTPCNAVHCSAMSASAIAGGSKPGEG